MKKLLATSLLVLTASAVMADGPKSPAQGAADYRAANMSMIGYHMGPMAMMAKGKMDFDADTFAKNADAMAALSQLVATGYAIAPDDSVDTIDYKAKAEIWENKEDFDAKNDDFVKAAAALAEAAKSGDKDAMMGKFKDLGKSCKACHKEYKEKD
jgi:cytochrome c556